MCRKVASCTVSVMHLHPTEEWDVNQTQFKEFDWDSLKLISHGLALEVMALGNAFTSWEPELQHVVQKDLDRATELHLESLKELDKRKAPDEETT